MKKLNTLTFLFLISIFCISEALAQVKTYQEVNGFDFGERITETYQSVRYLEYLEKASDRITLIDLGFTWDKRPMKMAIVTSPENHARLDEIKQNAQALNDPRITSDSEAQHIIENQPVIVYLGGTIHGFELSGTDALLKLLEKLVTENTPEVQHLLDNTVILLDPVINPDGRDAHAQLNHQRTGRVVNPDRNDWNNDFTRWQGLQFRTSHYYFDMNRDWFSQTHPEIRSRAAVIQEWRPQVGVDAHEMGSDLEFYFDPPTDPVAPYFPEHARRWFPEFGQAYADAFDEAGFEYMSKELFNYFYPAYTTSFLSYQGAVGMLFEQGSTRGLAITRKDGTVRTYADAIEQQFTAALATVRLSADRRQELLESYFDDHKKAVQDGRDGYHHYFITNEADPGLTAELVRILQRLGVEVGTLDSDISLRNARDRYGDTNGNVTLPAGSFVIDASQPRNRLIRTLFEPSLQVPEDFLELARKRIDRGENPRFYDITAWSLPLMFNVRAYSAGNVRNLNATPLTEAYNPDTRIPSVNPAYAYLIDGKQAASLSVLSHLRKKGYRAAMLTKPTQINGQPFASGTVIFRTGNNETTLHESVRKAARQFNVHVHGVDTGHADGNNPSLGSTNVLPVIEPRIAILAKGAIHPYSFGFAWFKLDQQYEIEHTILKTTSVSGTDLSPFNVIVMPEVMSGAMLNRDFGEAGVNRLKQWVQDGGTLVALGSASEYVRNELELGSLTSFYDIEDHEELHRISVPGGFVRGVIDTHFWLTSGYDSDIPFMVNSNRIFQYPEGAPSSARRLPLKAASENMAISGHFWPESLERLPGSALVYEERTGRGRVILFSEDTNFRGYWRGLDRMFLNAVVAGPSGN